MAIRFFSEGSKFRLAHPRKTSSWITNSVKSEKKQVSDLTFIFCDDEYLRVLNKQYLKHSTYTDILTFDYSEKKGEITGEIYISLDRVRENAKKYKVAVDIELHRVIIHGVLHLVGYRDKHVADKAKMREKEEAYLSLR